MKSKYFKKSRISERGKSGLAALANLPQETIKALINYLRGLTSFPASYPKDAEDIAEKTSSSKEDIANVINVCLGIIPRMCDLEDSPEDLVHDIRDLKIISNDNEFGVLLNFFNSVVPYAKNISVLRKRDIEEKVLPFLYETRMGVAIRPIYEKDFTYGKDLITEYKPEIIDYTAVAQIQLETSTVHPVVFQVRMDVLDMLISELLVVQSQLKEADKHFKSLIRK